MFNWSLRTKIITGLSASVVFVLLASISGIIGNGMYAFVIWSGGRLTNLIKSGWLPWIITLVILLACLGFAFFWWHRSRNALDTLNGICDLDDSLLRLLPSLIASGNQEVDMKRLLRELLRDATRPFAGHVHRASILLPDARREYLKIWAHHQIPDESVIRTQFYIGNEENRIRGVAGETFLDTTSSRAFHAGKSPLEV